MFDGQQNIKSYEKILIKEMWQGHRKRNGWLNFGDVWFQRNFDPCSFKAFDHKADKHLLDDTCQWCPVCQVFQTSYALTQMSQLGLGHHLQPCVQIALPLTQLSSPNTWQPWTSLHLLVQVLPRMRYCSTVTTGGDELFSLLSWAAVALWEWWM